MSDFADQKELTPEFYSFEPDFLINIDNLDVGDGKVIENVELPP